MRYLKQNKMYCFSPPIMIATFAIEILLAIFILFRYKLTELAAVVLALLTMLGLFQYAEYNVCNTSSELWSRIGYAAITTLPALGIHLFYLLSNNKSRKLVWISYTTMLAALVYFLSFPNVFSGYECTGNYVIFELTSIASVLYTVYYFGLLLMAIVLSVKWLLQNPKSKNKRPLIEALVVGYMVFLVPTATVTTLFPESAGAIPSIMCGFAVLFALILAIYIAPRALVPRK